MPRHARFPLLASASALLFATAHCGGSSPADAGDVFASDAVDAGDVADAEPLPPGPRGQILGVPLTEGEDWTIPTLRAPVQVIRTEAGIPHIYAANQRDAYIVEGFVMARDRYVQMELIRRLGLGLISQLLGDRGLAADQASRDRGLPFVANRILAQLTPEQNDLFDAFAEGINAYIAAVRARRLPVPTEITPVGLLLGSTRPYELMQPMTRRDLAAVLSTAVSNTSFTTDDVDRARVATAFSSMFTGAVDAALRRDGVVRDIFNRVAPLTNVTSAAGLGLEQGTMMGRAPAPSRRSVRRAPSALAVRTPRVPADVLERVAVGDRLLSLLRRGPRDSDHGSNAWATAGRANTNGAAVIAGDGHLPLSIPTLLYQMGVDTTVFGEAGTGSTLLGLYFPGMPLMPIGTNGSVGYSFTYLYGDLTDWYSEEVQLDASGRPSASRFQGAWRPLTATAESYTIADVPALMSVGRTENWAHWTTFDGRWIVSIEGRPATRETVPAAGESVVEMQGQLVIPADTNGDGRISAVSFDYTGFDINNLVTGLQDFERARTVADMRAAQRRFVGWAQNFVSADTAGGIHYSGYTATPCRTYLPRTSGAWGAGADPRLLIDGTQYGGFTIPLTAQGMPDETMGASDPSRCVIPFDQWPSALNPNAGFVLTANNDLGGTAQDNNLANDMYYLGGPWDVGYRARTIHDTLAGHVAAHSSNAAAMGALQGDHHSNTALAIFPHLTEAVTAARALDTAGSPPTNPADVRLLAAYRGARARIDEAMTRLSAWITRGANAASGVASFYDTPTADDRTDAAATMIFNAFHRELMAGVFGDESIDAVFDLDSRFLRITALLGALEGRGAGNPRGLASFNPATNESAFFDVLGTPEVESSREVIVAALSRALAGLATPPSAPGVGGFGTDDMSQYLWGLRHLVVLDSIVTAYAPDVMGVDLIVNQMRINPARVPLADNIPMGDPRYGLPWFPRPGDFFNVDAANPPPSGPNYFYRNGPVMRMAIELRPGHITGQNVIPGGESGVARSANFDDQARLWLGNRTLPMRYDVDSVVAGATGRERFHP